VNGVESISSLLNAIHDKHLEFNRENKSEKLFDAGGDRLLIHENIKNLFNTNDFMLMTINRCIDYTKVNFLGLVCFSM
jgi:hypothetical protein